MSKQDRQGVRTPADLERKYSFGQSFAQQGTQISRLEQELAQHELNTNTAISELSTSLFALEQVDAEMQQSISENAKAIDAISESLQAGVGIWVVSIEITEV